MELRFCFLVALSLFAFATSVPVQHTDNSNYNQCSAQCSSAQNLIYQTGKTYVYDYNSQTKLKLKDGGDDNQARILAKIYISVHSPCELSLQLKDVRFEGVDYGRLTSAALEKHQLMFAYDDGSVDHVCPHPDDEEYVVNIKKAILSNVQVSLKQIEQGEQLAREVDIFGNCDTWYQVKKNGQSILVTKTKDAKTCANGEKTVSAFFPRRYQNILDGSTQRLPIISQDNLCEIEINENIIRKVDCTMRAGSLPLSWSVNNATLEMESQLRFVRTENGLKTSGKPAKFERRNLSFKSSKIVHKATENEVAELLKEICGNTKNEINEKVPRLFGELVHSIRSLSYVEIRRLWQRVQTNGICQQSSKLRDIFTDALVMDASEGSLKMMVEMIENREVTVPKANYWLSMLTFANQPTESGLKVLLPLLKNEMVHKQAYLGVSAYAHNWCEINDQCQESQVLRQIVDTIWQRFEKLSREQNSDDELVVILRAISNLQTLPTEIAKFESLIYERRYSTAVRVAAIETIERHLNRNTEQLEKMVRLVKDQSENAEVRIAAYRAVMQSPRHETVKTLVEMLNRESSNQVGSYIVSHMLNMQETSDPHKQHIREALNNVVVPREQFRREMHRDSRNYEISHLFEKMNLGAVAEADVIYDRSYIPRSVRANLTLPIFGRSLNVMEVGLRQNGIENAFEKLAGPNSYLRRNNMTETMRALVEIIKSGNQDGKSIEMPRFVKQIQASTYVKVDGKYIAQMSLNDTVEIVREIRQLLESYGKSLKSWSEGKGQDRAFSFMLMDTTHEVSSPNGVPIRVDMNATVVLGYKLADRTFYPSFAGEFSARMAFKNLINNHNLAGIRYVSTVSSAPAIKAEIEYKNERPYKVRFEMPSENMRILSLKSRVIEIDNNGNEKEILGRSRKHEGCTKTLNKVFGIELCTKVQLPTPIVSLNAPFVPLNGAMDLELTIKKSDMQMRGYEIVVELPVHDGEWHTRFAFNTPGSTVNRKFEVELFTKMSEKTRQMNFFLTIPTKNIKFENYFGLEDKRVRASAALEVNNVQYYLVDAIVNQEYNGEKAIFKPEVKFAWKGQEPKRFAGIVKYQQAVNGDKVKRVYDITVLTVPTQYKIVEAQIQLGSTSEREAIAVNMKINHSMLKAKINSQTEVAKKVNQRQIQTVNKINYEIRGVSNNVEFKVLMQDISTQETVKYVNLMEMKNERYPYLNGKVTWNYINKNGKEIVSEFNVIRESSKKVVQFKQSFKYSGLENGKNLVEIHQLIAVECPRFNINGQFEVKSQLEMSKTPKIKVTWVGLNKNTGKDARLSYEFNHVSAQPLRITMDAAFKYNQIDITYTDRIEEVKPNEYKGNSVLSWSKTKNANLEYIYRVEKSNEKKHFELDAKFKTYAMQKPITHRGVVEITRDDIRLTTQLENNGKQWLNAQLTGSKTGKSNVDIETVFFHVKFDAEPFGENRQAKFELKHRNSKLYHSTSVQMSKSKRSISASSQTEFDTEKMYKVQSHFSRTQPSSIVVESRFGSMKAKLDFTKPRVYAGMFDMKANQGSYVQGQFSVHNGEKLALKSKAKIFEKYLGVDLTLIRVGQSYLRIETNQIQSELGYQNQPESKKLTFNARDKKESWKHETEIHSDRINRQYKLKSLTINNNQQLWNIDGECKIEKPTYKAQLNYIVKQWSGKVSGEREYNGKKSWTFELKNQQRRVSHLTNFDWQPNQELKVSTNTQVDGRKVFNAYTHVSRQQVQFLVDNGDLYGDLNMKKMEKISIELKSQRRNIQHKTELIREREGEYKLASKTEVNQKTVLTFNGKYLKIGQIEFQLNSERSVVKFELRNFLRKENGNVVGKLYVDCKCTGIFYNGQFELSKTELKVEIEGKYNDEKVVDVNGSIDLTKQSEITIQSKWLDGKIMYNPRNELKQVSIKLNGKNLPYQLQSETTVKIHSTKGWLINFESLVDGKKIKIDTELTRTRKINMKIETPAGNGKVEFDGEGSIVTLKGFWSDNVKVNTRQVVVAYNKNEKRGKIALEWSKNQKTEWKVDGDCKFDQFESSLTISSDEINGKIESKIHREQGYFNLVFNGKRYSHNTELKYDRETITGKSLTRRDNVDIFNVIVDVKRHGRSQFGVATQFFKTRFELDTQNENEWKFKSVFNCEIHQIQHETEALLNRYQRSLKLRSKTLKNEKPLVHFETELSNEKYLLAGETKSRSIRSEINRKQLGATIKYEDKRVKNKFLLNGSANDEKLAFHTEMEMNGRLVGKFDFTLSPMKESHLIGQIGKNKIHVAVNLVESEKNVRVLVETREIKLKHETQVGIVDEEHLTLKSNTLYNGEAVFQVDCQLALQQKSKLNINSKWFEMKSEFKVIERTLDMNILKKIGEKRRVTIHFATINPLYQQQYGFEFEVKHDADRDENKIVALNLLWKNVKQNGELKSEVRFNDQLHFLVKLASRETTCDLTVSGKFLNKPKYSLYVKREQSGERMVKYTGNFQQDEVNKLAFQLDLTAIRMQSNQQQWKGQLVVKSANRKLDGIIINTDLQFDFDQQTLKSTVKLVTPQQKKHDLKVECKHGSSSNENFDVNCRIELNTPKLKAKKAAISYSVKYGKTLKLSAQTQVGKEDWQDFVKEFKVLARILKQKWQHFEVELNQMITKLPPSVQYAIKQFEHFVDRILAPIHENKIVRNTLRQMRDLKYQVNGKMIAARKEMIEKFDRIRSTILKNEDVRNIWSVIMQIYHEIHDELAKNDYSQLKNMILEVRNAVLRPSTWLAHSRVIAYSPETGHVEIELRAPVENQRLRSIIRRTKEALKEVAVDMNESRDWTSQ